MSSEKISNFIFFPQFSGNFNKPPPPPPPPVRESPKFQNHHPLPICRTSFVDGWKGDQGVQSPNNSGSRFCLLPVQFNSVLLLKTLFLNCVSLGCTRHLPAMSFSKCEMPPKKCWLNVLALYFFDGDGSIIPGSTRTQRTEECRWRLGRRRKHPCCC